MQNANVDTKVSAHLNVAIAALRSNYDNSGVNLYFRVMLDRVLKAEFGPETEINYAMLKLENSGLVTKRYVRGAVAYVLNDVQPEAVAA